MSDKQAERIEIDRQAMELTPTQRRSYIRSDNRHKARRLERCVFLWWNFSARWRKDEMSSPGKEMLDV